MSIGEKNFGGWETTIGYEAFIEEAVPQLQDLSKTVLHGLSKSALRRTVHHPNGFLVNTLESSPEGQFRLHIWPTGRIDDLTPHSHPWHLASIVLAGNYVEFIPRVELDDTSSHELMVPTYNEARQQTGVTTTDRRVSFDLGESASYQPGDFHFLPGGAFHVTPLPIEIPFVTLVKTGPQLYDNPSFVKRTQNVEEQIGGTDRQPPTDEEIEIIWEQLAPVISDAW